MAINNDDDLESQRRLNERSRELTEEDILAREGFVKTSEGAYKKLETEYDKRTKLEQDVIKNLEKSTTAAERQLAKTELLYQQELKSIKDVITGSIDINDAQKRVIAQWKTSEQYLTAQRADLFKKQAEAMGGIVSSNGELLKNNGKLVNTTAELTKQQQKQLAELKISGAPGKAFGELADRLNSTKAITGEFSNKISEATKGSMGLTATFKLVSAGFEGIFNAGKVMTKSLYEGERGAKVGAKAISEFADSITTAMKGIGAAMMFIPGLGIAARIAGGALALLGQVAQTAAEANKVAAEQNDKLFESFNKLSEAGLAGAQGITGVFKTVQTLGMTTAELEKFNELLVANAKDLKLFGSTTAAGAEKFAGVAGELAKSDVGQKLEMLGVVADAQREHTLKYMTQQTRMGMIQGKSQQDLVKGAAAYIEELDKLSMLTGATRKEQEDARNAVMAEEELRAAMLQAELDGDTKRQQQLKSMADYATYLRTVGDTRGATGVSKYAAAGGPIDEASAAAMITYGKGIEAALNGKPIAEVIKQGNESSKDILKQLAGTKAVGGDISGLVTGKTGTMIDTSKMIDEAVKLVEQSGGKKTFDEALTQLQEERKAGDQRTKDNVEGRRLQQAAAQQLDSVAWTFNAAAKLNKEASNLFNKAVNKFNETVGAQPVAGGNIKTTMTGGTTPVPAGTPTAMPSTRQAAVDRQTAQTALETATQARQKAEESGRGTQEAKEARIAEANARLEAQRKSMDEQTANRNASRGLAAPKSSPTPNAPNPAPSVSTTAPSAPTPSPITTASALTNAGLIIKKGDVQAEGATIDPKLIEIAKQIQAQVPGFKQFTGFNDQYHQENAPGSLHAKGRALDFVLTNQPTKEEGAKIIDIMKGLGIDYAQDEYNNPSSKSTAGHFHGQINEKLKAYDGGIFEGPKSGYNVEMHGREAIIPLPDPSSVISVNDGVQKDPLSSVMNNTATSNTLNISGMEQLAGITETMMLMMENKFNEMIDKLSTGNDIQFDLLKHSRV